MKNYFKIIGIISFFILSSDIFGNAQSKRMKETKDRYLTKSQFEIYIKEHHGEGIYLPYFAKTDNIFYACDDDILLSHSPSIQSYLLKINREAVLHDWEVTEKKEKL